MAKNRKKKKNRQKRIIKAHIILIFFAVIINASIYCYFESERFKSVDLNYTTENSTAIYEETMTEEKTETENINESSTIQEDTTIQTKDETTSVDDSTTESDAEPIRTVVNPDTEDWSLIIVNTEREIPEGYVPELSEILSTGKTLDSRVTPYYEAMYTAAKEDGIILTPYSAYRSYERQKINYENLTDTYMTRYGISREEAAKKAATVILPPGTSEHNLGLAVDICNTLDNFAESKEYKWLTEHAHEYGFILRYTAEKQSITNIVPEPWHWRFVGVEYAEEIKNSGLCLEEWLALQN